MNERQGTPTEPVTPSAKGAYAVRRSIHGYAVAITRGVVDVLQLVEGSERNEQEVAAMVARLNAIDADAAERAKPIDAEWLHSVLGNQWTFTSPVMGGCTVTIWRTKLSETGTGIGVSHNDTEYIHNLHATRGQLLDLLAALKGGE